MPATFDLQGHRGARGLRPENTLPSFEVALDAGVTSIETDVRLTRDGVPVLYHDNAISRRLCMRIAHSTSPDLEDEPLVSSLTAAELRGYIASRNRDPKRFPEQDPDLDSVGRVAISFALRNDLYPYMAPTLDALFQLVRLYAGPVGDEAGKTGEQRERADRVIFDLELKRVPSRPDFIGDDFDGEAPGLLERRVVEVVRAAGVEWRTRVRSFDHRSVRAARRLAPELSGAVLVAGTAPVNPAALAKSAAANVYCPDYRFLDAAQVRACHAAGVRVIPWTVNKEADWLRLLAWGVDGITSDYPDRLAALLRKGGIEF